ncbi:MAG: FtsX-like permease family protein, partial [Gemmatimonadaceae bacterium]
PLGTEPLVRKEESALDRRSTWWLIVMARLKPGQTLASATVGLQALQPQIRSATLPDNWAAADLVHYLEDKFELQSAANGTSGLRARYQRPLVTIMVVVGLVLLIACGNIANLLLARATARRHELSVRQALGATRWRLARQLFAESLALSVTGAALGSAIAIWGSRLLVAELSTQTNRVFLDMGVDWRMLGFTSLIAMATALLFGVLPALRATRAQPIDAMKEQGRGNTGAGRHLNLGNWLVVAQVALSLVLVIAAGLFVRTFSSLSELKLGFDRDRVIIANVNAQRSGVDSAQRTALYERLVNAAGSVPGVLSASASMVTPVSGSRWNNRATVEGGLPLGPRDSSAYLNLLTPGWFATYGTRFLAGRDFSAGDVLSSPRVAIVNQAFVRRFIGTSSPLGRMIRTTEGRLDTTVHVQIVGLVEDAVYSRLRDTIPATMYFPLAQQNRVGSSVSISVRTGGANVGALVSQLSTAINGAQGSMSTSFRTLASQVQDSLTQERLVAVLSAFFGGLALLLAGLGLYGVTMYSVNMRRSELGIRMALGAAPSGVMTLVLRRVALQVGAGIIVGTLIAWWLSQAISALLFGLAPKDPSTIGGAVLVLAIVGVAAGWVPARRASRLDPVAALREE